MLEASSNIVAPESISGAVKAQQSRRGSRAEGEGLDYALAAGLAQGAAELAAMAQAGSAPALNVRGAAANLPGLASRDRRTSSESFGDRSSAVRVLGTPSDATSMATQELRSSLSRHDPSARLAGQVATDRGSSSDSPESSTNTVGALGGSSEGRGRGGGEAGSGTSSSSGGTVGAASSAAAPAGSSANGALQTAAGAVSGGPTNKSNQGSTSQPSQPLAKFTLGGASAGVGTRGAASPTPSHGGGTQGGTQNSGTQSPGAGTTATSVLGKSGRGGVEFSLQKVRTNESGGSAPAEAQEQPVEAQAIRGLAAVLRQQGGNVTLRLSPDSLGELRISMKLEGTQVWADIQTTTDSARDLLDGQRDTLRDALEARGLKVERLEVSSVKPETAEGTDRHHARDRGMSEHGSQAWREDAAMGGEDRRSAERWGGAPQDQARGGSALGAEQAGGAGEMVMTVRGAPVNVWAEPAGSSLRLRVDAVA